MHPLKKQARIAGLLYLLVTLIGPFVLFYVPGRLFVDGDAAATAGNILANESLYRAYIVAGLIGQILFIAVVLALYRLLMDVDRPLAVLMVIVILVAAPLAFLGVANEVATLTFLRDADSLAVFDSPQREAVVTLLVNFDRAGVYVSEMFWGLWLFPLGILVFRSGFLPRFLGVWLLVNGMAYVVLSLTGLLAPQLYDAAFRIALPALFAEMALMLWLLIFGARVRLPAAVAT